MKLLDVIFSVGSVPMERGALVVLLVKWSICAFWKNQWIFFTFFFSHSCRQVQTNLRYVSSIYFRLNNCFFLFSCTCFISTVTVNISSRPQSIFLSKFIWNSLLSSSIEFTRKSTVRCLRRDREWTKQILRVRTASLPCGSWLELIGVEKAWHSFILSTRKEKLCEAQKRISPCCVVRQGLRKENAHWRSFSVAWIKHLRSRRQLFCHSHQRRSSRCTDEIE